MWHNLHDVYNNSLKKVARYYAERPKRPDLPIREDLERISKNFSLEYLLAIMNSSVAKDFLRSNRRSNIHLYPDDWKKLPIPMVTQEQQQPIIDLVNQILAAKSADPEADTSALETQINNLVNQLYGLNAECKVL